MSVEHSVALCDARGCIRAISSPMAHLLGYVPEELIGDSFRRFVALNCRRRLVHEWLRLINARESGLTVQATLVTRDDGLLPALLDVTRLDDNEFLISYQGAIRGQEQLLALNAVSGALSSTLNLKEVLDLILDQALRIVPGEYASLILPRGGHMQPVRTRTASGEKEKTLVGMTGNWGSLHNVQRLCETGRPLIVNNCADDPHWLRLPGWEHIRSWMGVPLFYKGQLRGILDIASARPDRFTVADTTAALVLAQQAAAAIHHARLFRAAQARAKRLKAINDIGLALARLDVQQVIRLVSEQVIALTNADVFYLGLYDQETDTVRYPPFYYRGRWRERPDALPLTGLVGYVIRRREMLHIRDAKRESLPVQPYQIEPGEEPRTVLVLPLIAHDVLIGVLSMQTFTLHNYRPSEVRMLEAIANQTAIAIYNARLYNSAKERLEVLTAVQNLAVHLHGRLDSSTIFDLTASELCRMLAPDEVRIYTVESGTQHNDSSTDRRLCLALARLSNGDSPHRPDASEQSAVWHAVAHGAPIILTRDHHSPPTEEFSEPPDLVPPLQTWVGYPIQLGDQLYGVAALFYRSDRRFRAEDERTLNLLLNQTASALENSQYAADVTGRLSELNALYRVANQITGKLDLDQILRDVTHSLYRIFPCRMCMIALREPEPNADTLRIRAMVGVPMNAFRTEHLHVGDGLFGKVVQTGQPLYVASPNPLPNPFYVQQPELAPRSALIVPLAARQRVIGALGIDSSTYEAFTADHERLLTIAAAQIAGAIDSAQLYETVHDRAQSLADANRELEALDQLRTELVQNLSHELRSPLTFVKGYARLLHDGDLGPVTTGQVNALDVIERKADSITRLIADLMTLETLDARDLRLTRLDLVQLVIQLADNARVAHHQKPIEFKTQIEADKLPINGDSDRLNQVFDNLVGNAVKFSPKGGTIMIRAWAEHDQCFVSIADTGIGIAPDKLPYIFERFYQGGDSTRKRFGGAGLGLSIVRRIIEAHGGQVRVESQSGVGSTFTIQLPRIGDLPVLPIGKIVEETVQK